MKASCSIFFASLFCLAQKANPSEKLPVCPPESLIPDETTRRTQAKMATYPTIATYVSQSDPSATFDADDVLIVDGSPVIDSLLRFDNLPPSTGISDAVLTLRCTDSSGNGGTVFAMEQPPAYGTSWYRSPHRYGRGLREVAKIGRVRSGRTYEVDISRAFEGNPYSSSDGSLGLAIRSTSSDSASYSKDSVRLDFTLTTGGAVDTGVIAPTTTTGGGGGGGGRGPFQIMLWFDPNYLWQETSEQRSWCVQCSRRSVSEQRGGGEKGKQSTCEDGNTVRINECDDDNKLQWWMWDNGMFKAYTNQGLCWDYGTGDYYHMRSCGSSSYQTFGSGPSPNEFNTNGNFEHHRFEIYPKQKSGKCVTQEHHPRKYELLKSQICDRARRHKTSYWIATDPPTLSGHSLSGD